MAKSDKFYFDNLTSSVKWGQGSAEILLDFLQNYDADKLETILKGMHVYEQNGDSEKHAMSNALAKAFVTPIEREDLDALSHKIDDVTDKIEEVLQNFYIYNIKEVHPDAIVFAKHILNACDVLSDLFTEFANFKKSKKINDLIIKLNDIEEECDKLYLQTMRALTIEVSSFAVVSDKTTNAILDMLAWRKIFACFEACADACEHVGDCVATVVMKNT